MKTYIFLLTSIFLFIACSKNKKEDVKYQIIELNQSIPINNHNKDSIFYHIEFKVPQITSYENAEVMDDVNFEINKWFFNSEGIVLSNNTKLNFKNLTGSISNLYRKETKLIKEKFPELAKSFNYELIKDGKIIYNRNKILSVACEIYDYSGGAHGISTIEYLHFDMNTGQHFGIDELIDKSNKPKLLKLLSDKFEELKKDNKLDVFEDSQIETFNNFYFDDKDFIFVYNPYEIGPYSAGYISIKIPISGVKPLLKKDIHPGFGEK